MISGLGEDFFCYGIRVVEENKKKATRGFILASIIELGFFVPENCEFKTCGEFNTFTLTDHQTQMLLRKPPKSDLHQDAMG